MIAAAAVVEAKTLAKVILYSLISGVGIAVIFGIGVSSVASLIDAMRARRTAAGAAWGVLAVACVAGAMAAVILGIVVMSTK